MARGRCWTALAGLFAALALGLAGACTKPNPAYCEDAAFHLCDVDADAGAGGQAGEDEVGADVALAPDSSEVGPDQGGDVSDVTDAASDAAETGDGGGADVVPPCTVSPPSCTGDPFKSICDTKTNQCRSCRADDECNGPDQAGICLAAPATQSPPSHAARCVLKSDVIEVDSEACPVSPPPGGPFCNMKAALDQARVNGRRIIAVSHDQSPWLHNLAFSTNPQLTVVGRLLARFTASPDSPAITLTGVDVVVRGLRVVGNNQRAGIVVNGGPTATVTLEQVQVTEGLFGVQVDNAGRITIERSLLEKNATGLSVTKTPFTVRNTVIADSKTAGVVLDDPDGVVPIRFQNNTLYQNAMPLTCPPRLTASALLVYPPLSGVVNCTPLNSKTDVPPLFSDEPYHLTAASPCHNQGDTGDFPDVDLDGNPRPMGGRSDCGADEFKE